MIGEPEYTEKSVESVTVGNGATPPDSSMDDDGQGPRHPDRSSDAGTDTNARTADETGPDAEVEPPSENPPSHPFAGLFDVAIDGVATLAAHLVRQGLCRIVATATSSPASKKPLTGSAETGPSPIAEHKGGLLIAVAVAAIATTILWYILAPKKKSGP